MPGGTSSDFVLSCSLSPKRKRSRLRSWTRVSIYPLALFGRTILFTYPFSLFGADANTCGISAQSAAVQHQEIHLPHEGRPYTATLRTRGSHRGKALCPRRRRPRMSICIWRRLTTWNVTNYSMHCTIFLESRAVGLITSLRHDALMT